ncbi:Asparagine synthetase [glutamine-hydrolyzing] 1 [Bienertia sinuspersici]
MCGILAVLGCSDDSQAKRSRVLEVSRSYLSHQRLAIIDPASGDQPLYNENKNIVVTVNGEIYNHEVLRKSLPNHKFRTGSDCDVIAHLYEEHGENFIDMLDGVFSFVLLDTRDNSSVWISSELKGLHDDCEHFESFQPGHLYSSKTGGFRRWYNPLWFSEAIPSTPYDPLILRRAFENAVVKRLMTDVPFGVLLSGGLDSSLVASITSRHLAGTKAARHWGAQLHSFCVGLEGSPDLLAAREVADYLGTVHHEFHFSVQDGIDAIDDVIYHIESYDVTTIRASTPMFLMSRKIKSLGVKMIKALHLYDCLRANKATSAWGLEARVPFLDKEFINVAMSIDPESKMHILYRQKEQFSDGVGYSWIDGLKAHAEQQVTDKMMQHAENIFPHNTPNTKEAYYYRTIFERFFPQNSARLTVPGGPSVACSTAKAVEWDQAWSKNLDPSGRAALGVHNSAYEQQAIGSNNIPTKIIGDMPRMTRDNPSSEFAIKS